MIRFKSFSSGSCGNCYYVGIFDETGCALNGVLVDAGVSPRRLKKELAAEGLSYDNIDAVLVTHDHGDHIRSLGSICKHIGKPVFATPTLHRALASHPYSRDWIGEYKVELAEGWNELPQGAALQSAGHRISARAFEVPHDATQTVGYELDLDGYRFFIMTDAGRVTEEALSLAGECATVVIESNYDCRMLREGPYPIELQDRIRDGHGHLSNDECASALVSIAANPSLKNVFLCHLSEHNNTPSLATSANYSALKAAGSDARLVPLPRQYASPMFTLI